MAARSRRSLSDVSASVDVKRQGGWLPSKQVDLEEWLNGHRDKVREQDDAPLHPVILEFRELIDTDPVVRMYLTEMIEQVPRSKPYQRRYVHDVDELLRLINQLLTMAPEFRDDDRMVMTPLTAILDWTMGTPAGLVAYRDPRINTMIKKILDAWCEFLSGPDSRYVLNESATGWMSPKARQVLGIDQYQYEPDQPHWGFRSWNDFFTRRFTPEARPVDAPDDDNVIVNACESTPFTIATDVQRQSRFWIKDQPYSLQDTFAGDDSVDQFVGGTVHQAFLSATFYHRWHSPVSGTIVRAYLQQGTYFAEAASEDGTEPTLSQGFLAHVATRAIILIRADNPVIGLMAVVPIGMVEVSSCVINPDVIPGHHLDKGDELGYFQFGGSTVCLVFRPCVIQDFALQALPQTSERMTRPVKVRSRLATARLRTELDGEDPLRRPTAS